jgi:hypothetical protein
MDAFFGITLSAIVLYLWWRSETRKPDPRELRRNTVKARWDRKRIKAEKLKREVKLARKAARELEKRKQEDIELISVIIPTINNDAG